LGEHDAGAGATAGQDPEAGLGDDGLGARVPGEPRTGALGEQVEHHLPDVVPVARVLRAGVAQPDDEPGGVAHGRILSSSPPKNVVSAISGTILAWIVPEIALTTLEPEPEEARVSPRSTRRPRRSP